jgi:hypothetical protein
MKFLVVTILITYNIYNVFYIYIYIALFGGIGGLVTCEKIFLVVDSPCCLSSEFLSADLYLGPWEGSLIL